MQVLRFPQMIGWHEPYLNKITAGFIPKAGKGCNGRSKDLSAHQSAKCLQIGQIQDRLLL